MVEPIDARDADGALRWSGYEFARWLATRHPDLAAHTPILLRPASTVTTSYERGTYTDRGSDGFQHEHFAGHWRTGLGRLVIIYPRDRAFGPAVALSRYPQTTTIVVVQHTWDLFGMPELEAVDRDRPDLVYEPCWSDLAAHLGTPAPWWPAELRRAEHLTSWSPGQPVASVDVVTWPSWEPLYDMALRQARNTPLRVACFSIGHEIRSRAVASADAEIAHMGHLDNDNVPPHFSVRQAAERAGMTIPAVPTHTDPGQVETGTDEEIREGVAHLWRHADDLAVECLNQISMWTDEYMPFGGIFTVATVEATSAGREWIRRVRKTAPTAIHRVWHTGDVTGSFVDPVTGSPVTTEDGDYQFRPTDEVTFHSYAPRRLPAGSRITEVILDDPVWVRTQDGTLYPAPVMEAPGLSWGYSGGGPGTLADLVGRLLDDGAAHAITSSDGSTRATETNLRAFFQRKHPRGTRLPRRVLENVRANGMDSLGILDQFRYGRRTDKS